jgi:hypothetical protein
MPYVCCDGNRYIGEHSCHNYTYGNETLVRECCLQDYRSRRDNAERVAFTSHHPAVRIEIDAWNSLTIAEVAIVTAEYGGPWRERA